MVDVVERKGGQSRKHLKLAIEFGPPDLDSIDADQLAVCQRKGRVETDRIPKGSLRVSHPVATALDLSGDEMCFRGDGMVVRHVLQIGECKRQVIFDCRQLRPQEPVRRRRPAELAESFQVGRDRFVTPGPETRLRPLPDLVGVCRLDLDLPKRPSRDCQDQRTEAGKNQPGAPAWRRPRL